MTGQKVFISYSHKDKLWLDRLKDALKPLLRDSSISLWDDHKIQPGSKWNHEIRQALDQATAAVLLVSQDFLASDFIHESELPPLLEAARTRGLRVLWIPVKSSSYSATPVAEYQALHDPSKPLDSLRGAARNKALVDIATAIVRALTEATPAAGPQALEDSLERLLGFAYNFKGDGRTFFFPVDMLWVWLHAYQRFQQSPTPQKYTEAERCLSFLPSRPDSETGAEVLDSDSVDGLLDQLVGRGYLTRSMRAMGECFEITDEGRAYYSQHRPRIKARMDEAGNKS